MARPVGRQVERESVPTDSQAFDAQRQQRLRKYRRHLHPTVGYRRFEP
jgi:hypothetical protein